MRNVLPSEVKDSYLSFKLLEDVMNLPAHSRDELIAQTTILRIGPLVEHTYHHYGQNNNPVLSGRSISKQANVLAQALNLPSLKHSPQITSLAPRSFEFLRTPQMDEEFDIPNWYAFCKRLENAVSKAGFEKGYAQALAGTFEEMVSNVYEHCGRRNTGIAGYRQYGNEFEYVVSDAGIGVLASLQQNSDYNHILDSGQALATAVKDGETRHGKGSGHGVGFNRLLNIAKRRSYLRFRSGDHCYVIDGTQQPPNLRIASCAAFEGFLISIVCRLT